jgi:hypothetical protein
MGIKNVHIAFIAFCALTLAALGAWCFLSAQGRALQGSVWIGWTCFAAAVLLVVYGMRFLRKINKEGIK